MDDVLIPKDFKKYEPKLIAGLTVRQTLLLVPASAIAIILKGILNGTLLVLIITLIFSLVWALGWTNPYNMKFEEFVATSFIKMFMVHQ